MRHRASLIYKSHTDSFVLVNAAQAARATMAESINHAELDESLVAQSAEPPHQSQSSVPTVQSSSTSQPLNGNQGLQRYSQQPQQPRSRMFNAGFSPFSPEPSLSGFLPPSSSTSAIPTPPTSVSQQTAHTYENALLSYHRPSSSPSYSGGTPSGDFSQQSLSRLSTIQQQPGSDNSYSTFVQQPASYPYTYSDASSQQRQMFSIPAPGSASGSYNLDRRGSMYSYGSTALYLDDRANDVQRFDQNSYGDLGRNMATLSLNHPPSGGGFTSNFSSSSTVPEYGFPPITSYNLDDRQGPAQ